MATVGSAQANTDTARPRPSPAPSTTSVTSVGENAHFSLPASSVGSPQNRSAESVPASSAEAIAQNAQPVTQQKKPPMSQRLTRMFSTRNTGANATAETPASAAQASRSPGDAKTSPKSTSPSDSDRRPVRPNRDRSSSNTSKKSIINGTSTEKTNATSQKDEKKESAVSRRFVIKEDGTHEHFLKPERRQEKLSDMFKSLMIGRRKDGEVNEHQLSLMSSWVDQVKSEKVAPDQKGGPNYAASLVEKYGKCQEVVGRGAFGIVRISHKTDASDPKKEQLYAVKEFRRRPSESPKKYNKRLTSEFCISSALRHPNVIHTLDLLKDAKGDYCEVMEYCAGGDLYTLVLAAGKLEVIEADCYFKQLMRGVEYIHEMGVAHRDLKPENLLLTTRGALKITDFGNGECFRMAWEQEPHMVAGLCGSAPYIAPEEYIDTEFDPRAVDVWACGVIYMAMRTGRHLWRVAQKDEDEFYRKYLQGRRDEDGYGPIETLHRARCRNVIYSILDPNPTRRITASQVLRSEWGREIKMCKAGEEGF